MRTTLFLAVLPALLMTLAGCGPSEDERKAMDVFNNMDDMIKHGGYVKKFERFEEQPDKVFIIEAEIVDANDVPLGLLHSERVQGFGTARPHIQWYKTPGVREEWVEPQRHRGGRRGPREGEGAREWRGRRGSQEGEPSRSARP